MALVKDVVCGMMVDPETAPAKTYYFCAPGCKVAFEIRKGRWRKALSPR